MFDAEDGIAGFDDELAVATCAEPRRQEDHIELIASENYASPRVREQVLGLCRQFPVYGRPIAACEVLREVA